MSFIAAFICCKIKNKKKRGGGDKFILKIHKQSDFKQRELEGILSVSAVRYFTTVMN